MALGETPVSRQASLAEFFVNATRLRALQLLAPPLGSRSDSNLDSVDP
jgi:hypothetical protein